METEHKEDESECTFHDKCFKCDEAKVFRHFISGE
jgi:hypothetical protein